MSAVSSPSPVSAIHRHCAELDPSTLQRHLSRFDEEYVERFDPQQIAEHVKRHRDLSRSNPVELIVCDLGEKRATCTVLAFDQPFTLSLITGVLAGTGFSIESGEIFTAGRHSPATRAGERGERVRPVRGRLSRHRFGPAQDARPAPARDPMRDPVIVDHFVGSYAHAATDFDAWSQMVRDALTQVLGLLAQGDNESIDRAKQKTNELVTHRLRSMTDKPAPFLLPVELNVERIEDRCTRMTIRAQDTPAFLYALSTALSLHGLNIDRVRIRDEGETICDEIDLIDPETGGPVDPQLLERVRLSVLLTKQFTYFLEQSPNPYAALTRFEQMTRDLSMAPSHDDWADLLANPHAMRDLAKVLGASDFLWEDFIRGQAEALLPIFQPHVHGEHFCDSPESLPRRLEEALKPAVGLAEQKDRLNAFKDRETFLIDLDHILRPESDFRDLSYRLTLLAECLVATATRLVYDDLVRSYGEPRTRDRKPAPYAVFGLGKLGGVALGYASDIELLFVYAADGRTAGGKRDPIGNTEFYEQLAREASQFIKTKRQGIFEVDLRLRPYGKDGPLASSLEQVRKYYAPDGQAHPFERLALVRLRWIAGDARLGFDVERLRDQYVYENADAVLDLDALWDLWAKQKQQKLTGKRLNAKYSPGALVDLEGTVQLLQVTNARHAPQLRTPRLGEAMDALHRAGALDSSEYEQLSGAYRFLRILINALRMLRGSAQDLFLPDPDADELTHLARRCGYESPDGRSPAEQLTDDFERHTTAVRRFVRRRFERPVPGDPD